MYKYSTNGILRFSKVIYEHMEDTNNSEEPTTVPLPVVAVGDTADNGPDVRADQPATDQPATDQPATDQPATDQPATDQPATDQPATDQPCIMEFPESNIIIKDNSIEFTDTDGDVIKFVIENDNLIRYTNNNNNLVVEKIIYSQYSGEILSFHDNTDGSIKITTCIISKKDVMEIISKINKLLKKLVNHNIQILNLYNKVSEQCPECECPECECPECECPKCEPKEEAGSGMTENIIITMICLIIYLLVNKPNLDLNTIMNIIQNNYILIIFVSLFALIYTVRLCI